MRKSSTKPAYIYELRDPRDGRTYYVGKSLQPKTRLVQHVIDAKKRADTAKGRWITGLLQHRILPEMVIAREVTDADWAAAEAELIHKHHDDGSPLTNIIMNPGQPRPRVNMRLQDFWDDLTAQTRKVKLRMYVVKIDSGYGLLRLWNVDDRGWRFHTELYANTVWRPMYPPSDYTEHQGFGSRRELSVAFNWRDEALLANVFHFEYEKSPRVEDLAPEQLGHWPTGGYVVK